MRQLRYIILLSLLTIGITAFASPKSNIILENSRMKLTISPMGKAISLISKSNNEELLEQNANLPLCSITQYRPYDNENFLMFPAKPRVFPSNKVSLEGNCLKVEFEDTYDIAYIDVEIKDDYIGFSLSKRDYRIEDFGVKRKTELDEFALLQLPVKEKENFGEWLNVSWDKKNAVCLMATAPTTRIDAFKKNYGQDMYAGMDSKIKLFNSGAALIVAPTNEFLDCVATVENDFDMPRGVESRRGEAYKYSYYELRDVTTENIDEHIKYAKEGGFHSMVVYYTDFAKACGHYEWKDVYPNGLDDLKEICDKIRKAGMIPGFHIHYSKVAVTDPYICNGIPDSRTATFKELVLARPLSMNDSTIYIEGSPEGLRMEDGRRLVQIDDELIMFKSCQNHEPYALLGCERGYYNSKPASHKRGAHFRQLDVDDWPLFIRLDQNTSIQNEIAQRLGKIYNEVGFRFVYFDGAEDVPYPYWYNVSLAQLKVYDEFNPKPLFSEGALKSHYGWHILTRGNAFDLFAPEKIRPAMKKYTLRCASQIAKDFTSVNFGWLNYLAPSEKTIGMQPDMYEYICSKALAWNCPISLVGTLKDLRSHPRTKDNLSVINRWETAKLENFFTEEEKEKLKDSDREYLLLKDKKNSWKLFEYEKITKDEGDIRAFAFKKNGKNCVIYWGMRGDGKLQLKLNRKGLKLYDENGKNYKIKSVGDNNSIEIPFGSRLILESENNIEEEFIKAVKLYNEKV